MRLTNNTKFPHPVLWSLTGDYLEGEFSAEFEVTENRKTGALSLRHKIVLSEPNVAGLVTAGDATIGCIVRCGHTFYNDLRILAFNTGVTDFHPGSLLNKVTLRPVIWSNKDIPVWNPSTLHSEFSPPVFLKSGDILAVGNEIQISVGQAKLTPIESIFELNQSSDVGDGEIRVDLDCDRISILVSATTFALIDLLRQRASGSPVVMNAIYLPAVMEVLDRLRDQGDAYENRRWFTPFTEKCRAKGVVISPSSSVLEGGQRLLESPILSLHSLLRDE